MNYYTITAQLRAHYTVEDPKCPSYWRGSGVYDIEVPCTVDIRAEVVAESEDDAVDMVLDYDYYGDRDNPYDVEFDDDPKILSVDLNEEDYDDKAGIDIYYVSCDEIYDDRDAEDEDWER